MKLDGIEEFRIYLVCGIVEFRFRFVWLVEFRDLDLDLFGLWNCGISILKVYERNVGRRIEDFEFVRF